MSQLQELYLQKLTIIQFSGLELLQHTAVASYWDLVLFCADICNLIAAYKSC